MTQLLSDEELRKQVANKMAYTMYGNSFDAIGADKRSRIAFAIVEMTQFINTQKRLYAEMVVGEDNEPRNSLEHSRRNFLRKEQRARIK